MYCPRCGKQAAEASKYCPDCGQALTRPEPDKGSQTLSIASLVLAVAGFELAAMVTGMIALVQKRAGRAMAIAGVAVAAARIYIALAVSILVLCFALFVGIAVAAKESKEDTGVYPSHECTTSAQVADFTDTRDAQVRELETGLERACARFPESRDWDEERGQGPEWFVMVQLHLSDIRSGLEQLPCLGDWDEIAAKMTEIDLHIEAAWEALATTEEP